MDYLVVSSENIIPSLMDFQLEKELQMSGRGDMPDAYFPTILHLSMFLSLLLQPHDSLIGVSMQAELRDISAAYRKKTIPRSKEMVGVLHFIFINLRWCCV